MTNEEIKKFLYDCSYEGQYRNTYEKYSKDELITFLITAQRNHNILVQKLNLVRTFGSEYVDGKGWVDKIPPCFHPDASGVIGIF